MVLHFRLVLLSAARSKFTCALVRAVRCIPCIVAASNLASAVVWPRDGPPRFVSVHRTSSELTGPDGVNRIGERSTTTAASSSSTSLSSDKLAAAGVAKE
ncbi:hypothetical protein TcCL_Unassigned06859 [Trypanosoma cruzi]|nr:hypothetical protein TcCL_Unassigned06859 [Trypanosoma cruzi]